MPSGGEECGRWDSNPHGEIATGLKVRRGFQVSPRPHAFLARPAGFEPATLGLRDPRSSPLSYGR